MTFGELKTFISTMSDEQLAMPVAWTGDERGGTVKRVEVLEEDHINPSGDGMEPLSSYASDPDFEDIKAEEPVVACKGQPLLVVD